MEQSINSKILGWWCFLLSCGGMTAADRRNYRRFHYWVLAWGLVSLGASFLLLLDFAQNYFIAAGIVAVSMITGVLTFKAYADFFRALDELTQKIQLEGLKFGFAVGVILLPTFQLFDLAGLWQFRSLTAWGLMIIGYWFGQLLAVRRYR